MADFDQSDDAQYQQPSMTANPGAASPNAAAAISTLVSGMKAELFTDGGEAYCSLERIGHLETWEIDTKEFQELLAAELFNRKQFANERLIADSIYLLKGRAKHEGIHRPVALRSAKVNDGYCIDLGNAHWNAVLVTPGKLELVSRPPVRFRRGPGFERIHVQPSSKKEDLQKLLLGVLNMDEADLPLVVTWMLDALRPDSTYPILEITGQQGSSKSTTQKHIRMLVDPNANPLLTAPRRGEDIVAASRSNLVLSYNNLSFLTKSDQDLMCSVSTGGSVAVRKLYTNFGTATIGIKRPIIFNGIDCVGTNPDFVDRVVSIELPVIPAHQKRTESALNAEFERVRPEIVGGLLDLFAAALAELPNVQLAQLPRMADYATLGQAICTVQGWPDFELLYGANRKGSALATLDASPVARAVQELADHEAEGFRGTFKELLARLLPYRSESRNWPQTEKALSTCLKRYAPVLLQAGIRVEFSDHRTRKGRLVAISKLKKADGKTSPRAPA